MVVAPLREVFALRKRRFTIRNAATADGSARDNRDCRLRSGAQTPEYGETCSHSGARPLTFFLRRLIFGLFWVLRGAMAGVSSPLRGCTLADGRARLQRPGCWLSFFRPPRVHRCRRSL